MPSIEVIYLLKNDTLDTVRELLQSASPAAQVWLVAPWRWSLARDLVSLKRLQRSAQAAALDLRLVIPGFTSRVLAREAGLAVHATIPFRLRRYKRARRPDAKGLPARVLRVDGRLGRYWRHRPRYVGFGAALVSLLVIVALVAIMAGVAVALVPTATITLKPTSRSVSATLEVSADPTYRDVEVSKSIIPARVVQVIVEGRGDTPTTGRTEQPDAHATGEVVFSNKTTNPVKVPKGTIVRTGSGLTARFRTVGEIELPATLFGSARVGITAADPGPIGNVQALTISIVEGEVARSVDVLNDKPTQGGLTKAVATVHADDINRLREDLKKRLLTETYAQVIADLREGEFIPQESLAVQVMSEKFDQVENQQTPLLSMSMKVVVKGVAVDGSSLETLARRSLEAGAGQGMSLIGDSLVVERSEQMRVEKNNVVRFSAAMRGEVAPLVDVNRVKEAVRGRKVADATRWLSQHLQLTVPPEVVVQPEWWDYVPWLRGSLPWLPGRIEVAISVERP